MDGFDAVRLSEDRIKRGILDPDLDVRDKAIRYFSSSTDADASVMSLAIEAFEKYGTTNAFSFCHHLNSLPQTRETLDWVIAQLREGPRAATSQQYFFYLNLSRLCCHADVELVAARAPEILDAANFDAKTKAAFRGRVEMRRWDADACWQALLAQCEIGQKQRTIEEFDLPRAEGIIAALARHGRANEERIMDVISGQARHRLHWLRPLAVTAAGALRLEAAIPFLVHDLGHPDSLYCDRCHFALASIGSDEVVAAACDRFASSPQTFRAAAADLLGKIHSDLTVRRALQLLPGERDEWVQQLLCIALVAHFSYDGIEPTRRFILRQALDPNISDLRADLVTACKMMDVRFAEFDAWQEAARQDQRSGRDKLKEVQQMAFEVNCDLGLLVEKMQAKFGPLPTEKARAEEARARPRFVLSDEPPAARGRLLASAPVANRRRVGRNDSCPCGSGRKFKNCCLGKAGTR